MIAFCAGLILGLALSWTNIAAAQSQALREQLIQRSLQQLHVEQFDSAFAACATLRRWWPDDPAGYLNAANIYQTMMRDYRVRLFEAQFDSLITRAMALAEQQLRAHPAAEMFFVLGSARGYHAMHRFRRGEWSAAFREALVALNWMDRARMRDPDFVDPILALALYEYWKSVTLDFGIGLFARKRDLAIRLLEKVWAQGRYLAVEAAYSLQTIHLQQGNYGKGLAINDWLYQRFSNSPVCLYHRALFFEKLNRPREALVMWEKIVARIQAFKKTSDGFLAECHLHRAQIYEISENAEQMQLALTLAAAHAQKRDKNAELESPLISFDEIKKMIEQMLKKYSLSR